MRIKAGITAITVILLLCFCQQVCCQSQGGWDRTLDRYELICERCIELLEQKRSGMDVSQESLSSLLTQLSLLKSSLSEADEHMSPAQKMRFEMIRRRFATIQTGSSVSSDSKFGTMPKRAEENYAKTDTKQVPAAKTEIADSPSSSDRHFYTALPRVSNTFPVIIPAAQNQVIKAFVTQKTASESSFTTASSHPQRELVAGLQAGVFPTISLGGFAAFCPGRYGIYLKGRTDMVGRVPDYSFSITSDGRIDGGGKIWSDGEELRKRLVATAGGLFKAGPMAVYAGAGYGSYRCFTKGSGEQWGLVNDLSLKGLSLDLGLMTNLGGHLFGGAGVCVTGFRYTELEITLGLRFGNNQ